MVQSSKKIGFRRSNSWIHTWSGLPFIWLLYFVFLTGTLSFFRAELDYWLQPELHVTSDITEEQALRHALNYLDHNASNASQWRIDLPDARYPVIELRWFDQGERVSKFGGQYRQLSSNGSNIAARETRFADFLYRVHFDLYGIPRELARWIVGIATLAMLIALITGIIVHKKIFAEFFTFRPNKGQRSWMDLHNASSVLMIPFHLMITLSGLFLLMYLFIPWGIESAFDGDRRAYMASAGGRSGLMEHQSLDQNKRETPLLETIAALHTDMTHRWPSGISRVQIENPTGAANIELRERSGDTLFNQGRGEQLKYEASTGQTTLIRSQKPSVARATYNVMAGLHKLNFAAPFQRWVYFIAGLIGTLMIASGAVLWVVKRQRKPGSDLHRGINTVRHLNLGALIGLPLAIAAGFWANRLLPMDFFDRQLWEVRVFFIVWGLCFIHSFLRSRYQAWQEQCLLTAALYAMLPLYNLTLGNSGLPVSLMNGDWILVSVDSLLILFAILFFLIARVLTRLSGTSAVKRNISKPLGNPV